MQKTFGQNNTNQDEKRNEVYLTEVANLMAEISPAKIKRWRRQEHSGTPRRGYSIVSNAERILKKSKKASRKKVDFSENDK